MILRGINRQRIFEDDEDRERFLEIVKKSKEKDGFWVECPESRKIHRLESEKRKSG